MLKLLAELKRRQMFRVAAAYAVMLSAGLVSASVGVVAAQDNAPLKGLKGAPILHFPTVGTECYGLDPLAPELRVNDATIRDPASAGFNFPLPPGATSGTTTLATVSGAFIRISDTLLKINEAQCVDSIQLALMHTASVRLEHTGQMLPSPVQLWAVQTIIIGGSRDDYLVRRQLALAQMFSALAAEWKKQNGN